MRRRRIERRTVGVCGSGCARVVMVLEESFGTLFAGATDVTTEVGVGDELAGGHVDTTDGGTGDDGDERVDLSGGLHTLHGLSEKFGQHSDSSVFV